MKNFGRSGNRTSLGEGGFQIVGGMQETRLFQAVGKPQSVGEVLAEVYRVLDEKGYDPIHQIVGYLLSGDPTYITREVRSLLRTLERDEVLEELVRSYLRDRE